MPTSVGQFSSEMSRMSRTWTEAADNDDDDDNDNDNDDNDDTEADSSDNDDDDDNVRQQTVRKK